MSDKPTAIILGGTFPHKSLIQKLKTRGYHTILIDYLEYSPAIEDADEHIRESTLDKERVLEIAEAQNASLVISTCIDQANVTACYVGEKLGLPIPYSYEQALLVSNKALMKNRLIESSIPTAKHREFSQIEQIDDSNMSYPLVVKPSDSNSSKGVRKVDDRTDLTNAAKEALTISRDGVFIVEEYLLGTEIGVDCYIYQKEVQIIMTRERRKISQLDGAVQQIQGSFWPAGLNQKQLTNIQDVVSKIAHSFELDNTLLMMQAILIDNDVFVLEFSPRIGGGENYKIIEHLTGCDVISLAIDSFLNKSSNAIYHKPESICADVYLYANPGFFDRIIGLDEQQKSGNILYWNKYKQRGYKVTGDLSSNNRIGSFVVEGANYKQIIKSIEAVILKTSIQSDTRENLLNYKIYIE